MVVDGPGGLAIMVTAGSPAACVQVPGPVPLNITVSSFATVWSGPAAGERIKAVTFILILLHPSPDEAELHSAIASVGGAPSGLVASGSVTSAGRSMPAATANEPAACAVMVPVMVNVRRAPFAKSIFVL